MVQIGEGALNEVHDMLHRANELTVKAATGTLQDVDRAMIDMEIQQLKAEIDRTAKTPLSMRSVFSLKMDVLLYPKDSRRPSPTTSSIT